MTYMTPEHIDRLRVWHIVCAAPEPPFVWWPLHAVENEFLREHNRTRRVFFRVDEDEEGGEHGGGDGNADAYYKWIAFDIDSGETLLTLPAMILRLKGDTFDDKKIQSLIRVPAAVLSRPDRIDFTRFVPEGKSN